jgi:regulator of protease activity HflC (stomatin/prohibitin superfamily)
MLDRLIELLEGLWGALLPWVVLQPFEQGVLVRLGTFKRVLGPGFHWIYPLHIDKVWDHYTTPSTHHISGLCTTTKDGKAVGFDAIVTYRIVDIEKAMLQVTGVEHAILDACQGVIGTALSESTWHEILHGDVVDDLTKLCARRGRKWGVEIMSVQPIGTCLVRNIRLSGLNHSNEMQITV